MSSYQWAKADRAHEDWTPISESYMVPVPHRTGRYIQCQNEPVSTNLEDKIRPLRALDHLLGVEISESNSTTIPQKAFSFLGNIPDLVITNTNIDTIAIGAFNGLAELPLLSITRNKITKVCKLCFTPLRDLKDINLSFNLIDDIEDGAFGPLLELRKVNISHNLLTVLTKHAFENLNQVKSLDLSYNRISQLNEGVFETMTDLIELYLNHNYLSQIGETIIFNNLHLLLFYIEDNFLTELGDLQLPHSTIMLHFKGNHIEKLRFTKFTQALILDLTNNEMELHSSNFANLSVETLLLDQNSIRRSPSMDTAFGNLTTISRISLGDNQLNSLSPHMFENNTALKHLLLDGNNLTHLIKLPSSIEYLSLRNNSFNSSLSLNYLIHLKHLDISMNNLTNITYDFFKDLTSIQTLQLQNNQISKISIGSLRKMKFLKMLDLSNNHITSLEVGTFNGANNLAKLDLSHNKLSMIGDETFHNVKYLSSLDVSFNNISMMNLEHTAMRLPLLKEIGLAGNHWGCSDLATFVADMIDLKIFAGHDYDVVNIRGIACQKQVKGIKLADKTSDTFFTEIILNLNIENTLLLVILLIVLIEPCLKLCNFLLKAIRKKYFPRQNVPEFEGLRRRASE